jgi:hypothetical protein
MIGVVLLTMPALAAAQASDTPFRIGGQIASVNTSEFDTYDTGVGALFSWVPSGLFGVDAELNIYPEDLGRTVTFSPGRVEGLFGVTVGPRLNRLRPFAKVRPGFVNFAEVSGGIACIAIYPPPLTCQLAGGSTNFALDLGGGVEVFPSGRTFIRFDAGDRMVRYPGPSFDLSSRVHEDAFFAHNFRLSIGGGFRF